MLRSSLARRSGLVAIVLTLAACGGASGRTTSPTTADAVTTPTSPRVSTPIETAPSATVASATPTRPASTTASTAKPLGEHVIAEWKVNSPAFIYILGDSVWVPGHGDGKFTRIDPASNEIVSVVSAADAEKPPVGEAFGSQWQATRDNKLNRVDPATGESIAVIELEDGFQDIGNGVVLGDSAVWVIQPDKAELIKIDPQTNRIVSRTPWATLIEQAKQHTDVPAGKGPDFMWLQMVGDEGGGGIEKGLLRLDPNSGAALTFLPWAPDQNGDGHIEVTDDALWYGAGGHMYRINVAANEIDATYPIVPGIIHLAIGFGSVWLVSYEGSLVQRLDVAL